MDVFDTLSPKSPEEKQKEFDLWAEIGEYCTWGLWLLARWPWWPLIACRYFGGHSCQKLPEPNKRQFVLLCIGGAIAQFLCIASLSIGAFGHGSSAHTSMQVAAIMGTFFLIATACRILLYFIDEFDA